MRIIDCEQGSDEWLDARIGVPTGSNADRILTPKTRKPSTQAVLYRNQLLAEWLLGLPIDWNGSSEFMDRGRKLEAEAIAWYELQYDVEVERVGFVVRDDGQFGGSPDGLVGSRGVVETKCPALHTHIGYMLDEGPDHTGQVQSYLALTGREWCDVVSYHPDLPPVVTRIERDEDYIRDFGRILEAFIENLKACREKLAPFRTVDEAMEEAVA